MEELTWNVAIDTAQKAIYQPPRRTMLTSALNPANKPPDEQIKMTALFVAMVVRNALENFHSQHLSDAQMKELNPLIRGAIYNALYVYSHFEISSQAQRFVHYHTEMIPSYWEMPQRYESLKDLVTEKSADD